MTPASIAAPTNEPIIIDLMSSPDSPLPDSGSEEAVEALVGELPRSRLVVAVARSLSDVESVDWLVRFVGYAVEEVTANG